MNNQEIEIVHCNSKKEKTDIYSFDNLKRIEETIKSIICTELKG